MKRTIVEFDVSKLSHWKCWRAVKAIIDLKKVDGITIRRIKLPSNGQKTKLHKQSRSD